MLSIDSVILYVHNKSILLCGTATLLWCITYVYNKLIISDPWEKTGQVIASFAFIIGIVRVFCKIDGAFKTNSKFPLSNNDIALVTGGAKGLGKEMVYQLLNTYCLKKVYVLDIINPEIDHPNLEYYQCDVGIKEDIELCVKGIIKQCNDNYEHVSVYINNAGIRHGNSIININPEDITRLYNVNTFSYIWAVRLLLKNYLLGYKHQRISIVTISSVLGTLAPRNLSIYSSTKAALSQLHEGLAIDNQHNDNVCCLLVIPGQLDLGMFNDVIPGKQFLAPIVDHKRLAETIIHKINIGETGVLFLPLYTRFLPIVKVLPFSLIRFCRWFSEMDQKVKS